IVGAADPDAEHLVLTERAHADSLQCRLDAARTFVPRVPVLGETRRGRARLHRTQRGQVVAVGGIEGVRAEPGGEVRYVPLGPAGHAPAGHRSSIITSVPTTRSARPSGRTSMWSSSSGSGRS